MKHVELGKSHSVALPKTVTTELFIFVKQCAANIKANNVYIRMKIQLSDEKSR